jgi:thymidylate synthase (FAD)
MADMTIEFKTSEQCRVELVAHTVLPVEGPPQDVWYSSYEEADFLPVSAARASFQKEDKTGNDEKADKKLLKFLCEEEHFGVFEHNTATFIIECPLFIRSQIQRHRTFSYNEWSRRYTDQKIAFWKPDDWRKQSTSNKQCSGVELAEVEREVSDNYFEIVRQAWWCYGDLIDRGVSKEQARAILPQSLLTQFYMSGNLRNWSHFIKLRKDSHAQYEVRVIAERIEKALRELWPNATEYLFNVEQ